MRQDWQTANRIKERAVERVLLRRKDEPVTSVGVDKKSFRQGHVYASILNDLDNNRVWDLVEGRMTKNASELFEALSGGNARELRL